MEDIVNPYWTDLNEVHQYIFWNSAIIDIDGYLFVTNEHNKFDLAGKIAKLDAIIDDVLTKLKEEKYEYKEELTNNIKEKKKLLKELLANYNAAKEKYLQFDEFYRDLFNFHLDKFIVKGFADEHKRLTQVMNNIQVLIREKFLDFRQNYFTIRNSFFEANKFIIKVRKLFNY